MELGKKVQVGKHREESSHELQIVARQPSQVELHLSLVPRSQQQAATSVGSSVAAAGAAAALAGPLPHAAV
jgi:hypothetical protein